LQEALKDLLGDTIQNMLEAELDEHLGYEKYESTEEAKSNYRNGYTSKTLKSSVGQVEIDIPRDRNAEFEPKIVPKYKRDISEIENKIIAMYARGMSTREINEEKQKENKKEMMYGNASRSATGHRVTAQDSKKKGIPNTTGDVVFRVVVGPLRSGKSINLGEGVLLWGDLHKDAVIKALCVIVMGRLQARLLSLRVPLCS